MLSILKFVCFLVILFNTCCVFAEPLATQSGDTGSFTMGRDEGINVAPVDVFYYKAEKATASSPIVMVLPGGGRNGDDYRDAWISSADKYGLLILSPSFSETGYPGPLNYNLGRMIAKADRRSLDGMELRTDAQEWIFDDIDRIFEFARQRFASTQTHYDFFGHSAGGQIGHRLALFHPGNKARTIVAANAGWYTAADTSLPFPFGLKGAPTSKLHLDRVFANDLVVFLGELDNADETRGHLRTGPQLDAQGPHRLARGTYFYDSAREQATALSIPFKWRRHTVAGVGHSYREMSKAAADYLYGELD